MLRFSLSALFIAVFVVALFCAALAYATLPWLDVVRTLTYFVLLSAAVSAIVSKGRAKAVAVGMAVFGWGFVYLADPYSRQNTFLRDVLDVAFDATHGPPPKGVREAAQEIAVSYPQPASMPTLVEQKERQEEERYSTHYSCFSDVLYVGLTLLCTIFGGFVGRICHARACSSLAA